jgi:hypothetical protein
LASNTPASCKEEDEDYKQQYPATAANAPMGADPDMRRGDQSRPCSQVASALPGLQAAARAMHNSKVVLNRTVLRFPTNLGVSVLPELCV